MRKTETWHLLMFVLRASMRACVHACMRACVLACGWMDVQDLYRPLVLVIVPPIKCSQTAWYCGYWFVLKCEDSTDADVLSICLLND